MEKQKTIADWMDENELTAVEFAIAIRYSQGAVSKWRQRLVAPTERAERAILRVQKRKGWTAFPARIAV